MKTIWKFPLQVRGTQTIVMPEGAELLSIQEQNEQPCLWVLVNPEAPKCERVFETIGTGAPIKAAKRKFIDTYQLKEGSLVFHVFELE